MAKTKAPKEKKEKAKASVATENNEAVIITGFVLTIKSALEKTEGVSDVRFAPTTDGYRAYFKLDGKDCKLAVDKKTLTNGYRVVKFVDGFKKSSATLKTPDQYQDVIDKVLNGKKAKKEKKKKG